MLHSTIKAVIEADNVRELDPGETGWIVEINVETWHTGIRGFPDWLSNKVAASLGKALKDEPLYCRLIKKEETGPKTTKYCFLFKESHYNKNNE